MPKQIVVTGYVRPTSVGSETLSFSFNMGQLRFVCIANVPPEGETEAPVYVKMQLPDDNGEYPSKNGSKHSPRRVPLTNVQPDDDGSTGNEVG